MKFEDDEYKKLEKEYLKSELEKVSPKPTGMMGRWAFDTIKKREFKEMMIKAGRILREKK